MPSQRDVPETGRHKSLGKQADDTHWKVGVASVNLSSHRIEIDEPRFEDRPRRRLQRCTLLLVEIDLVVEIPEYRADRALLTDIGRHVDRESRHVDQRDTVNGAPMNCARSQGFLEWWPKI